MKNNEFEIEKIKVINKKIEFYDYIKDYVSAIFFIYSIRLYKEFPDLSFLKKFNAEQRELKRRIYSHSCDFDLIDSSLRIKTDNSEPYLKTYNIDKFLYLVRNNFHIDLVTSEELGDYLDYMHLPKDSIEEIKAGQSLILTRPENVRESLKLRKN